MSTRHVAAESARLHDLTPEGASGRASKRFRQKLASDGFTVDEGFQLKPGYLYTVVRAISARVNQNYDGWPSEELKKSYKTFIGKPVFVNHENHDPTKARGVVVAARYAENGMDKYIEVVQEIDAKRFPKLAHEIKSGGLDSVSMGAEAGFTICSYCHNKATEVEDMCDHVLNHKGKTLSKLDRKTGKREDVLIFESCHKISFFELSYVFEPADETAVASKVVVAAKEVRVDDHGDDDEYDPTRDPSSFEYRDPDLAEGYCADCEGELGDRGVSMPVYHASGNLLCEDCHNQRRSHDIDDEMKLYQGWNPDDNPGLDDPRIKGASRRTAAEDLSVPAPPGAQTIDQSVIDSTPVVNLTPATELTGHEAPGLGKSSAFDADIAEITKMAIHRHAGECPPGMDCSRGTPKGEQIFKDSPNNPVNQVSYDPASLGKPGGPGAGGGGGGGGGGSADGDGILPGSRALYDQLLKDHPGANIGGYRPPGDGYDEHANGALDFMTTDDAQAAKVREQAFAAGAPYAIWKQQQWNPDGSVSAMEDRGSATQNHYDHVHIAPLPATPVAQPTQQTAPTQPTGVQQTQRAAGKYTKDDFNHPSGLKPWERDTETDADDAAAIEIEAMMHTASPTDDYWEWKSEHGDDADKERHGPTAPLENRALQQWVEQVTRRTAIWDAHADDDFDSPDDEADWMGDKNSHFTQLGEATKPTYVKALNHLNNAGAPEGDTIDFGAGRGLSGMHPQEGGLGFHTYEPYAKRKKFVNPEGPDFTRSHQIEDGSYHRLVSLNVLNVIPPGDQPGQRNHAVREIGRILAPGGHAVISTRPDLSRGVPPEQLVGDEDPGAIWVDRGTPRERKQKGFSPSELHAYAQGVLGDGFTVNKVPGGLGGGSAIHIIKNPTPTPRTGQVRSTTAMKKIARSRALKLAFGEKEAPMAVDTLREEGSAPEDDNDEMEEYVDKPDFASTISAPTELQDPDLSQASQIDRQQEVSEADAEQIPGAPNPADMAPQQQFITLQIPVPAAQQSGVPMSAAPAQAAPAGPPMPVTASLLDYFDSYYGRRVANWMDAIESNRDMTPAEAADYRRQTAKLSTLENGRELSTTDRYPGKEPANMARNTIANRNKVARAGRRQHFAEGPLVDGGERGRNDQGEQEAAFLSQTPPAQAGEYATDDTPISNTEHNLVARVQQGRAQLLRDAQQLASLQQRRALTESGGPTAVVVNPTVNTGPEGEALTGEHFVSADPNDGVVPTNPKDASLRAFQAFDGWLAQKTGSSSRRHSEANIKKAAAQFAREAGISPQALFPALGIVLREARKNDKQANTKGAKMRKRSNESLEVAAPDGRVDVESPVENVTSAEAQASQFDLHDFGNNAGDNVAKPDLSTDQNWAPGEASGKKASIKTAGGLLAMRCAEGMIAAGLEPNSRERKYALAAEFERMNRGLIQDRVALLERFAAVRDADRRKVASGSSRGAARSPIPAGLGGGTRTAAAGMRVAAHDPSNDSSLFI